MSKKKLESQQTTYFIDGTNVCYWVDTEKPTLRALLQLMVVISEEKEANFFCIFDANTHYKLPEHEKPLYKKLLGLKENFYQVTGGKRADDYILELAQSYNAPVVSNDNYNDPKYKKYKWLSRDHKPCRLFMGEVIPVIGNLHLILSDLDVNVTLEKESDALFMDVVNIVKPEKIPGTVKFFNPKEGWGRVVYETDIYFNKAELPNNKVEVEEGDQIAFLLAQSTKGPYARRISLLPPKEEPVVYEGTVVSFDEKKQMGNIQIDGTEKNLFFYKSYFLDAEKVNQVNVGQSVEFIIGTNRSGKCARKVRFTQKTELEKLNEELNKWRKMVKQLENAVDKRNKYIDDLKQQIKRRSNNTEEPVQERMDKADEPVEANAAPIEETPQEEADNATQETPQKHEGKKPNNSRKQGGRGKQQKQEEPSADAEQGKDEQAPVEHKTVEATPVADTEQPEAATVVPEADSATPDALVETEQETAAPVEAPKKKETRAKGKAKPAAKAKAKPKAEETSEKEARPKPEAKKPRRGKNDKPEDKKETKQQQEEPAEAKAPKTSKRTSNAKSRSGKNAPKKQAPTPQPAEVEQEASDVKTPLEKPAKKQPAKKSRESNARDNAKEKGENLNQDEEQAKQETPTRKKPTKSKAKDAPANPSSPKAPPLFDRVKWWGSLGEQWQKAFNVVVGRGEITERPDDAEIDKLFSIRKLSFYPTGRNKLSFKLTTPSGLAAMTQLVQLNLSNQDLKDIQGLSKLRNLKQLNCKNNKGLSGDAKLSLRELGIEKLIV